jgi:hypothetical protein
MPTTGTTASGVGRTLTPGDETGIVALANKVGGEKADAMARRMER